MIRPVDPGAGRSARSWFASGNVENYALTGPDLGWVRPGLTEIVDRTNLESPTRTPQLVDRTHHCISVSFDRVSQVGDEYREVCKQRSQLMTEGRCVTIAVLLNGSLQRSSDEDEPFEETTESASEFRIRTWV